MLSFMLASSVIRQAGVFVVVAFCAFSAIFLIGEKVLPFRFGDTKRALLFLLSILIIVTSAAVILVSIT